MEAEKDILCIDCFFLLLPAECVSVYLMYCFPYFYFTFHPKKCKPTTPSLPSLSLIKCIY